MGRHKGGAFSFALEVVGSPGGVFPQEAPSRMGRDSSALDSGGANSERSPQHRQRRLLAPHAAGEMLATHILSVMGTRGERVPAAAPLGEDRKMPGCCL